MAAAAQPESPADLVVADDARRPVNIVVSIVILLGLAGLTRFLDLNVPAWAKGTDWEGVAKTIEYPVYAILLGLAGGAVLVALGVRDRYNAAFRTEFFIKTGLVLLGASINLQVIFSAAGPSIAQALIMVTSVFLFVWFLAGLLGIEQKLRALLASALSICGVSAAIAAAGAVQARKEDLAYATGMVILFAVPLIFIQPWLVTQLGLSQVVAGAWIGGNIDTTAAVTAAGAIVGDDALKIAGIVKMTQNALIGVVAFVLAAWFVMRVERVPGHRPDPMDLWRRFPKFVLGFILASIVATWWQGTVDPAVAKETIGVVNTLRTWFLILAFVSIGLEFRVSHIREAGWRPLAVFATGTVFNLLLALLVSSLLFAGVSA
jgi:uncharacterized integral membrane protein (TIGR00698 family)